MKGDLPEELGFGKEGRGWDELLGWTLPYNYERKGSAIEFEGNVTSQIMTLQRRE